MDVEVSACGILWEECTGLISEKKIVFCNEGKWCFCWEMMDCGWLGFIALFVLTEISF